MKKIVCYGDSNTFGFNPVDFSRYDENTRWSALLQKELKDEYIVINEGLCDRTGFVDNPKGFMYSSQKHFPKFISKSDNIDILLLWIGTNDVQFQYNITNGAIEKGLENLIILAKSKAKNIVVISPVELKEKILEGYFKIQFDTTSIIKSKKTSRIYRQLSNIYSCNYININKIASPSDTDGLHYDSKNHKIISKYLSNYIKQNF